MAWFLNEVVALTEAANSLLDRGVSYKRVFKLHSDSGATMGASAALEYAGVPRVGDAYFDSIRNAIDISARCGSVRAAPLQGEDVQPGNAWMIEAAYQNFSGRVVAAKRDEPLDSLTQNPLTRPASLEWGMVFRERQLKIGRFLGSYALGGTTPIMAAQARRPVTASTGEPFPELPTYEASELALVYRVNLSTAVWTPSTMRSWANAVNSTTFLGDAAHTWKITDIRAPRVWEAVPFTAGLRYYDVTYTLEYKSTGWYRELTDEGTWFLETQGSQVYRYNFESADGKKVTGYLNGNGQANSSQAADQAKVMRYLPLDWPEKDFATIPGGPINP